MGDAFKLIIEDDEGKRNVVPVDLGTVTVGRHEGNAIRLNERNVSRQHMRLVKENGHVFAEDLDSYNGVFINGNRVTNRQPIHEGDLIRVGDFHLELRGEGLARRADETTQKTLVPDLDSTQPEIPVRDEKTEVGAKPAAPTQPIMPQAQTPPPPQPQPQAQTPAPTPVAPPPSEDDGDDNRAEPTAIIRLDQLQALEADRTQPSGVITGEKPKLLCVSTNFAGRQYDITKSEAVIGRTDDNDIAIDHRSVSRNHAKIITSGDTYKIVDLGSANGTLVNGEQYAQLSLKAGDLIELGHVKFRFIPPGASYTPTDEERAAIDGKPAPAKPSPAITQDAIPTMTPTGGGLMGQVKANPLGAITAGAVVLGVLVFVSWLAFSGGSPEEGAATGGAVGADGDGVDNGSLIEQGGLSPADKLVAKAQEYMAEREWKKASKLLKLAVEKDPGNDRALSLMDKVESELRAKKSFDAANKAIKSSNWDDAWNLLGEISESSSYNDEAEGLREQVRGALITQRVNEAHEAIEGGKEKKASEIIAEIEALDSENAQLAELKGELATADKPAPKAEIKKTRPSGGSRHTEEAPAPKAEEKKPPKREEKKPPKKPPPPPPADNGDPKAQYKKGLAALQSGQTKQAIEAFNKCVQIDRSYCYCYRALGISHARAGNGPKAARYYRLYLKYCPTAPDAAQVKKLLEAYGG